MPVVKYLRFANNVRVKYIKCMFVLNLALFDNIYAQHIYIIYIVENMFFTIIFSLLADNVTSVIS